MNCTLPESEKILDVAAKCATAAPLASVTTASDGAPGSLRVDHSTDMLVRPSSPYARCTPHGR